MEFITRFLCSYDHFWTWNYFYESFFNPIILAIIIPFFLKTIFSNRETINAHCLSQMQSYDLTHSETQRIKENELVNIKAIEKKRT